MAVYFVGLVVGNRRHRAAQLIDRFHDGLAWLAQMVMFVMLGLLVTPSQLLPTLIPAVLIALFLVVVARPVATVLCLLPFRFAWNEHAFIGWVGLRGAVAIFLGTIPVLVGVENSTIYFEVAFVVVLVSLIVQGWTLAPAARLLDVELPPSAEDAGADRRRPARLGRARSHDLHGRPGQPHLGARRAPAAAAREHEPGRRRARRPAAAAARPRPARSRRFGAGDRAAGAGGRARRAVRRTAGSPRAAATSSASSPSAATCRSASSPSSTISRCRRRSGRRRWRTSCRRACAASRWSATASGSATSS